MFAFLLIVTILLFCTLVIVAGLHPTPYLVSQFELQRRSHTSHEAKWQHRRETLLPYVYGAIATKLAVILVGYIVFSILTFGWALGIIIAIAGTLLYPTVAHQGPINRLSQRIYNRYETPYLDIVERLKPFFNVVRAVSIPYVEPYHRFDSRQELQRLIEQSGNVLSDDEKKLVVSGLSFAEHTVESIMTPKSMMKTIKKSEFLGPLVLSEIHELGHSRLPVIAEDIDHVVGVLYSNDLLSLDIKKSVTAEKAMEAKVFYIRHDDTLERALAAFLESRHHLFIVINEMRETVGLLTLEDVIEKLIGRKIVDENDTHENLRVVAEKIAHSNNTPSYHVDV
ncbi:MAG: CBS domain-containing protein [Candidatus Microsaccharimonas sossegonensis]|uniref:CBS domain-containing protein n=1 Tax=Candidatus Microsaccharimonas sossegonensis TaxID=2506948 RepID=A0A4Q0AH44_9BACT|nr:MAG: CBS domain-containing protein [Candidatus Microsaccharimonas sossegonensis]